MLFIGDWTVHVVVEYDLLVFIMLYFLEYAYYDSL